MKPILYCFILCCLQASAQTTETFTINGVPAVYINLFGNEPIKKDSKQQAHMQIINANGSAYEDRQLYDGLIEIEGRGNTTWGMPKKPYNIDLIDSSGDDNATELLGMPEDEEWSLIANYSDKSMLRNALAYYLGNAIKMEYSPRYRFVEVYLDSVYQGLYMLCEKIKKADSRVNIKKLTNDPEDQSEPRITGGYIIEVTPAARVEAKDSSFTTAHAAVTYTFKYPKSKNITTQQIDYIEKYMNEFEAALFAFNFKDSVNGYIKYIDVNSFVDWYIINELAKNNDAIMFASCFFYKNREGKLKAGPLWDFDIGFGNVNYNDNNLVEGFWARKAIYFNRLFQDPAFQYKVQQRWAEIRPILDSIPVLLATAGNQLSVSGAIDRNFEAWPVLGTYVWPNIPPYPKKYSGELTHLINWIQQRINWLNIYLQNAIETQCDSIKATKPVISIIGTDEFDAHKPFAVHTLGGFSSYYWNNKVSTSNDTIISLPGKYWVSAKSSDQCETLVSDTLYFDTIPVLKLISFDAEKIDSTAHLTWQASDETDSDYYIVQRSFDGKDFTDLKQIQAVPGKRGDTVSYSFVDMQPQREFNIYRLKFMDDGIEYFSKNDTLYFDTIPVLKLLKFAALRQAGSANISWTVADETNDDYFIVQRKLISSGADTVFKDLLKIDAKINGDYQFVDPNPEKNLYAYRLKFSDNGKVWYSTTDTLDFRDILFAVYPNPAKDIVNVKYNLVKQQDVILQVVKSNGSLVFSRKLNNVLPGDHVERIQVSGLGTGAYFVYIKTKEKIFKSIFLKR